MCAETGGLRHDDPPIIAAPQALAACLGARPLTFRHRLGPGDGRFRLQALAAFAASLPKGWVRCRVAPLDALAEPKPSSVAPGDAVASLATNGHTVRLYHLHLHPSWHPLAVGTLDDVLGPLDIPEARPAERATALFLASPGAVTPWHPDRHHNLLLQVRGTKRVTIGRFPDPGEAQRQLERTFLRFGAGPTVAPPEQEAFDLGPGDGIYIPPCAMHTTVVTGTDVSVALSLGWSTSATERAALVHTFNAAWRCRTGRAGRPPGRRFVDRAKATVMRARLQRAGRRSR